MARSSQEFAFNCQHCARALLRTERPTFRCDRCGSKIHVPDADGRQRTLSLGGTRRAVAGENLPTRWGRHPFWWDSWYEPRLQEFRYELGLDEALRGGGSQTDAQVRLRHMIREVWFPKRPRPSFLKRYGFWRSCRLDTYWFCTHYARMYVMAAAALGMPARILNIARKAAGRESTWPHMVNDIWSDEHQKWIFQDPLHDFHYESAAGVPLSAQEARDRFFGENGRDLFLVTLRDRKGVQPGRYDLSPRPATALQKQFRERTTNLFWILYYHGQNYFTVSNEDRQIRLLMYQDARTRGHRMKNLGKIAYDTEPMVFETTDRLDVEPTLQNAEIQLYEVPDDPEGGTKALRVYVSTLTPNLKRIRYRVNGGGWRTYTVDGFLLPDGRKSYRIEAQTENLAGRRGRASVVEVRPA